MNIQDIAVGNGVVLTGALLSTNYDTITDHQITRYDFADDFVWGGPLDMDGGGLLAARYVNGTLVDARYLGSGDDEDAIQRAINWIGATTETKGIVYLNPRASAWSIGATISVPSGISIIAHPAAEFSLDFNGYAFTLASGATDVTIEGVRLDGNQRTGGLIDTAGNTNDVVVRRCSMGLESDPAATYADGRIFDGNTYTHDRLRIEDCQVHGGGGIVEADGGAQIRVRNCLVLDLGGNVAITSAIDLDGCDYAVIEGCHINGHDATTPIEHAILLTDCDYATIRDVTTYGCEKAAISAFTSRYLEITGCSLYNASTGGSNTSLYNDTHCIVYLEGSNDARIYGNTITGIDDISGTIPINHNCPIIMADGAIVGSSDTLRASVFNNFFSDLTDGTSGAPVGEYKHAVALYPAVAYFGGSDAHEIHSNHYCRVQQGRVTYGSGASANVTLNGLPGAVNVLVTGEDETIILTAIAANQITVSNDAATLAGGQLYYAVIS